MRTVRLRYCGASLSLLWSLSLARTLARLLSLLPSFSLPLSHTLPQPLIYASLVRCPRHAARRSLPAAPLQHTAGLLKREKLAEHRLQNPVSGNAPQPISAGRFLASRTRRGNVTSEDTSAGAEGAKSRLASKVRFGGGLVGGVGSGTGNASLLSTMSMGASIIPPPPSTDGATGAGSSLPAIPRAMGRTLPSGPSVPPPPSGQPRPTSADSKTSSASAQSKPKRRPRPRSQGQGPY